MGIGLCNNKMADSLNMNMAQNYLKISKSMEKLASGFAINSAADDPAGLVISEQMRTRIASLNREIESVSYQINKYQTADSALLQERGKLSELRSLAVAAADDGWTDETMREAYQAESDDIVESYNLTRITTQFGSQELLDGSPGSVADVNRLGEIDLSSPQSAAESLERIDDEISQLDRQIAETGAEQKNSLESSLTNLRIESQNLIAAESQIRDIDFGREYSNFIKNQLLLKSDISLFVHSTMTSGSVLSLLLATE